VLWGGNPPPPQAAAAAAAPTVVDGDDDDDDDPIQDYPESDSDNDLFEDDEEEEDPIEDFEEEEVQLVSQRRLSPVESAAAFARNAGPTLRRLITTVAPRAMTATTISAAPAAAAAAAPAPAAVAKKKDDVDTFSIGKVVFKFAQNMTSPNGTGGEGDCKICMTQAGCCIMSPCNHAGICIECAKQVAENAKKSQEAMPYRVVNAECPFCRKPIAKVKRFFF
jgi:hypothetical protein